MPAKTVKNFELRGFCFFTTETQREEINRGEKDKMDI
jgi:hypothetical protein